MVNILQVGKIILSKYNRAGYKIIINLQKLTSNSLVI